jgi:hypothetical protein
VYVLVRMTDASRTVYSIMVENAEGGDCLATQFSEVGQEAILENYSILEAR